MLSSFIVACAAAFGCKTFSSSFLNCKRNLAKELLPNWGMKHCNKPAFSLVEMLMKSVSRCGWQTALSRMPKHYDGDEALAVRRCEYRALQIMSSSCRIGCEPCKLSQSIIYNRRNTHRNFLSAFQFS